MSHVLSCLGHLAAAGWSLTPPGLKPDGVAHMGGLFGKGVKAVFRM